MPRLPIRFPDLVIAIGETASNEIESDFAHGQNIDYTIYAPATLPETVTVQMSPVNSPAAGDWVDIQKDGTDVTLTAGKGTLFSGMCKALRLSSGATAAERTFRLIGQVEAV